MILSQNRELIGGGERMKKLTAALIAAFMLGIIAGPAWAFGMDCKAGKPCLGNEKPNVMFGSGGADIMRGLGNADSMDGDTGADQMYGGDGPDGGGSRGYMFGGLGNDIMKGGKGADAIY